MILRMADISKTYRGRSGEVVALERINLSVDAGQFVAIQGPSGCGKSTLLLIAGGLLAPDSGTVHIGETDPFSQSAEQRARLRAEKIGFVFQQFHLIPYLNVIENILTPVLAGNATDAARRADQLLARFGLSDRRNHVPAELSTGERQRTAMARALLNEPQLLLADEPTGNLDGENAQTVLDDLAEFSESGGAVLLVTHDSAAAQRAGRTIVMQNGCQTNPQPIVNDV